MPIPRLPITLAPLSGPPRQATGISEQAEYDSDDEEDNWDGDDESNNLDDEVDAIGAETDPAGAAAPDAARYMHLCDEYERSAVVLHDQDSGTGISALVSELPSAPPRPPTTSTVNISLLQSEILDASQKPLIDKMIEARHRHQYTMSVRSERAIKLDPKLMQRLRMRVHH